MWSSISSQLLLAAGVAAKILYAGVDESGGEFGVYGTPGTGLPGRFGVDYAFTNNTAVDIYAKQNKINVFRVAFLLERMCPVSYGLGAKFNETYFSEYKAAIDHITMADSAFALLDPHNYMRYNDPSSQPVSGSVIGNTSDPTAATTADFQAFWHELAHRFKSNERVIFGIMNEPHDMPTSLLLQNDQAAINGIRAAGAKQMILAPGNGYTGGHAWLQSTGNGDEPSGNYLYQIKDPLNNTAMDVHEYLDVDFSGGHQVCNQSFATNLAGLTGWLQQYGLKAFVSEFGGDNNTMCDQYLTDAINYMAANDEYIGWSAWAAGPLWGTNAPCCSDGALLGSLEPGSLASDGSPGLYYTVWLKVIQPLLPKTLKRSGISSIHG